MASCYLSINLLNFKASTSGGKKLRDLMWEWFNPIICERNYLSTFLPFVKRCYTACGNAARGMRWAKGQGDKGERRGNTPRAVLPIERKT
jgi:hypothetical protein